MKLLNVNNNQIAIYASADEMPIKRYSRFQKYLLVKSGVGDNIEDCGKHLAKLFELLSNNMTADALAEAKNLYYNFHIILEEESVSDLSFACLVASVNGEPVKDFSEEGLRALLAQLAEMGLTKLDVDAAVEEVKKKIYDELRRYIPSYFDTAESIEFYGNIKRKIMLLADEELPEEEVQEKVKQIDLWFLQQCKPMDFDADSKENVVLLHDIRYEDLCASLANNGIQDAQNLSVLQFYLRLDFFKKQAAAMRSQYKQQPEEAA